MDAKAAVKADQKAMKDKAGSWRPKVLALMASDAKERSEARKQARSEVVSTSATSAVTAELELHDDLILTRKAFRRHKADESDLEEEEADVAFDALLLKQGQRYAKYGKDRVRCHDPNSKIRSMKGTETKDTIQKLQEVDENQENLLRRQILKRSAAPTGRETSESPPPLRSVPNRHASAHASGHVGRAPSGATSNASTKRSGSKDDLVDDATPKKKHHGEGAAFLAKKDALSKGLKKILLNVEGKPSSMKASLDKATEELTKRGGSEEDCPHSSPLLQKEVAGLVKQGGKLDARVKECNPSTFDATEVEVAKFAESVEDARGRVQAQIEAMSYKVSMKSNEARSSYQKAYWQVTKVSQHLIDGCFGNAMAKLLAEQITKHANSLEDADYKPTYEIEHLKQNIGWSDFTGSHACLWYPDTEVAKILSQFLWPSQGVKDGYKMKEDSLGAHLTENTKLHGSVGAVDYGLDYMTLNVPEELKAFTAADHAGCRPWIVGMRQNFKRHGPLALPSPGPPVLVTASKAVIVHCYPASSLVDIGIPVGNYEHFVSTPDGQKAIRSASITIILQPGCFFYVPAGHLMSIVWYRPLEKKAKQEATMEFAFCSITPMPFEKSLKELPANTKTALLQWHRHQAQEKKIDMWNQRKVFLETLLTV